jgi:hypothetical protein
MRAGTRLIGGVVLGALLLASAAAAEVQLDAAGVHIDSHRVKVHKNGVIKLRLTCKTTDSSCEGSVRLQGREGPGGRTTRKAMFCCSTRYEIAPGTHQLISMNLGEEFLERLRQGSGELELIALASSSNGQRVESPITIIEA